MHIWYLILQSTQVLVAVCLISLFLLQRGHGADVGAAFGSGASTTVFGSKGAGGFLLKFTVALVVVFLANSIALTVMVKNWSGQQDSLMGESVSEPSVVEQIDNTTPDDFVSPETAVDQSDDGYRDGAASDVPLMPREEGEPTN